MPSERDEVTIGVAERVWRSRIDKRSTDRRTCFVPGEKQEKESKGGGHGRGRGTWEEGLKSRLMCLKTV